MSVSAQYRVKYRTFSKQKFLHLDNTQIVYNIETDSCLKIKTCVFSLFAGFLLFVTGFAINIHSDHILRNLRKPGEIVYKIPYGTADPDPH